MATIQKTVSEQMPVNKDFRVRKTGPGEWELVVGFDIGNERFQAVRSLSDKPALVNNLKDLAAEAIQAKVVELGFTVV